MRDLSAGLSFAAPPLQDLVRRHDLIIDREVPAPLEAEITLRDAARRPREPFGEKMLGADTRFDPQVRRI